MSNTEETMTTEEYIRKQNQIDLDAEFDKALKASIENKKSEQTIEEYAKKLVDYIIKFATVEAELSVWEEMLEEKIKYNKHSKFSFHDINIEIASREVQYNKMKKKLDKLFEYDND